MSGTRVRERGGATRPATARPPTREGGGRRGLLRTHRAFLVLLGVGVVLRVVTHVAYRPAMFYIDSYSYLEEIGDPAPGRTRPVGYVLLLLRPLAVFEHLSAYPVAHHLLGLGMGVATYALLVHRGARRGLAALAAAPVLLDAYQLHIEQNIMSDTLFQAMVLGTLVLLTWRLRPGLPSAALAGLVLGAAVTVRLVGQPLVIPLVLFLLLVGGPWRRRVLAAVVAAACFAAPVAAYGLWYAETQGTGFALAGIQGRTQYARTAPIADCATLELEPRLEPLCPTPEQQRELGNDGFAWGPGSPSRTTEWPTLEARDAALGDFATSVVRQQPLEYVGAVAVDFLHAFRWAKTDAPGDPSVARWQFQRGHPNYAFEAPTRNPGGAAEIYGGAPAASSSPLTAFLRGYQFTVGGVPGPFLLVALLAGVAGALGLGRARRSPLQPATVLWVTTGGGLLLASMLFEFSWRYQLPALVLLPVAGALGWTAMRWGVDDERHAARAASMAVEERALADFRAHYGRPALAPVVIVIAAYDEADGIGAVLDELPGRVHGLAVDVVVVVDGATDGTAAAAAAHGVHVADVPVNRGQGAALRLGYRIAREGGAAYVVTTDADGQYDPAQIAVVLEPLLGGHADFVTGSRRLGRQETDDAVRHVGVRVFARLVSALTGHRVTDTSFGLRAMRAEVTGAVTLDQPQYQASELLIGVLARGYRVVERPATMRRRTAGASKKGGNLVYGYRYGRVVLTTWWRERPLARSTSRSPHPRGRGGVARAEEHVEHSELEDEQHAVRGAEAQGDDGDLHRPG